MITNEETGMGTDGKTQISTDRGGLYKELTYRVIGALYEVHNALGSVHKEAIYRRALAIEFKAQGIGFEEEPSLSVMYKSQRVGVYKPDFIIEDRVVLELKAVPIVTKGMLDQAYYYIRGTKYKLVLLVNFGTRKLTVKRRIYT